MKHNTATLRELNDTLLKSEYTLPLYTSNGERVWLAKPGKYIAGCVHESLRAAEKCGHNIDDWENADDIIILEVYPL